MSEGGGGIAGATSVSIPATDGFELAASLYEPAPDRDGRRAVIVVNSGTGIVRRFYGRFAAFLAENGFPTLTWDYRGIGASRPRSLRGFVATMRDWGERDLEGVLAYARGRWPDRSLLVVGHSAGGQVVGLAPRAREVAGLLAVAAQSGYYRHWPAPRRFAMAALWRLVMPAASTLLGFFPAKALGLGEDLPRGVALEWARWCRSRDYMVDETGRPLRPHFAALAAPILAYSFADDPFAPRPAVEQLLSFYENAPTTHRHVRPAERGLGRVGHFGFFRETYRDSLWAEALDWLRGLAPAAA